MYAFCGASAADDAGKGTARASHASCGWEILGLSITPHSAARRHYLPCFGPRSSLQLYRPVRRNDLWYQLHDLSRCGRSANPQQCRGNAKPQATLHCSCRQAVRRHIPTSHTSPQPCSTSVTGPPTRLLFLQKFARLFDRTHLSISLCPLFFICSSAATCLIESIALDSAQSTLVSSARHSLEAISLNQVMISVAADA
ncbi:hypothetical protein VTN77DRAFT_2006 [Rasamsonia byssochlamydoides]|uniref:uncharacterized protein n=1 Tax=Rasamsonia byssochlamydoides TaxID=89139 RepID=UPI003742D0AA